MYNEAFSSIDLVGQCLMDQKRTEAFKKIILSKVKSNSIVLDVGTGSGILAIFAAKAGAKKVYALEYDKFLAKIAQRNFINNGLDENIKLIIDDAKNADFPRGIKFDVVIMEMLTTGMIDEFQVQAINNLHKKGLIDHSTIMIPEAQTTFISAGTFDFNYYEVIMKMPLHLWNYYDEKKYIPISCKKILHSPNFLSTIDESLDVLISITVMNDGIINCIQLSSQTILTKKIYLEDTISLNPPVIIPVEEKKVEKGEKIILSIAYKFGFGFQYFNVKFK